MEFKEGIAYAGICNVVGGWMWFCITSENDFSKMLFWRKNECIEYVRNTFPKDSARHLLNQLYAETRRAFCH